MYTYAIDRTQASDRSVVTDRAFGIVLGVLFILVYTQGYLERIGVPGGLVKVAVEFPVLLIAMLLINRGQWRLAPGFSLVAMYTLWVFISAIYNDDSLCAAVLYVRYTIYAYIIFAAVWCMPMTRITVDRINLTLVSLWVLQIVAAAYEVFVLGERVEAHVGTLTSGGGELATAFPLFAMALTVPLCLYSHRNPILLVLPWAFLLVGYASGKRAIYFYGPCLYSLVVGWYVMRVHSWHAVKRGLWGAGLFVFTIPALMLGISQSKTIGQATSKGYVDQSIYALEKALDYTTAHGRAGNTLARTATTKRVLNAFPEAGAGPNLFGWGPSAVMGTAGHFDRLVIDYGITGWTRDLLSVGWPGMAVYVLFYLVLYYRLNRQASPSSDPTWQAMRFGADTGFIVLLICHLTYGTVYACTGALSFVYLYLLALVMSPKHEHLRTALDDSRRCGDEVA